MVGTGCILEFRLPPRSGGRQVLGLSRHEWSDIHAWISFGFILLIIVHLIVHRVWLVKIASSNQTWRLWVGLSFGLFMILFLLLYPVTGSP